MATHKPQQTFTGQHGDNMEGTKTVDQIKNDAAELVIMFDPASTHLDNIPGGIDKGHLKTRGGGSGIVTDESSIAINQNLVGGASTGNIIQLLSWMAKKIKEITNQPNWYDEGGANASAYEANGTTVKEATHAVNADLATNATNAVNAVEAVTALNLEVRTSDPSSPEIGRIWMRSNL